jgi:hypothetical protein
MPRSLTPGLSLDGLKKEAKRWLKALRANDADARDRFRRALPHGSTTPALREVQLALAREFGLDGWTNLKHTLAERAATASAEFTSFDDAVLRFLDNACPDHHVRGGSDHVRAEHTALRLLERYPEIATENFYTAVVCGNLDAVTRELATDAGWARRKSGEVTPVEPAPAARATS